MSAATPPRSLACLVMLLLASPACASSSGASASGGAGESHPADGGIPDASCPLPATPDAGVVLVLPAPTGPFAIGRDERLLVDPSRSDPYSSTPGAKRTFVVELFYPADPCASGPLAPYALPAVSDYMSTQNGLPAGFAAEVRDHGRTGVPMVADGVRHPVLLLSHGLGAPREIYTTFAEDFASRGYVVASVSHTYDTGVVVFPDGMVVPDQPFGDDAGIESPSSLDAHIAVWVADEQFALDQLATYDTSDALVGGRLDLAHVGAFGHSYGGAASVQLCAQDPRPLACANLDGAIWGTNVVAGSFHVGVPVLLFSAPDTLQDPTFSTVYAGSPATSRWLILPSAGHWDFCDLVLLLDAFGVSTAGAPSGTVGPIDPARALHVVDVYLAAFFDLVLRGTATTLLDGASPDYPEVTFINKSP